ncbi:hypothetical protein H5410_036266 [Solanum commersonii]|uniref:Uncharacterized protein n=1 Tax=Solanum commersonii TaxID=4109 RepID=A0A9J5Y4W0_SOLCO|nr:hypothetical protein H5410_036266 [Solanum commersonii]
MTHKDETESGNDEVQNQMVAQESISVEEVKMLRQHMAEMYEAWMNGQAPPSSIREYLNANMSFPIQVSTSDSVYPPGFGPYVNTSNTAGTSSVHPLNPPMMNNPLFMPTVQTNAIPQPTLSDRDLIEALILFWDLQVMCLNFSDFELAYIGEPKRREQILEQMHIIYPHKECLDNGLVFLEFMYSRYGKKEGFLGLREQLKMGNTSYLGKA